MPMKDWLHRLQPVQLYIVLVLSICYFIVQLILSHITHALTLLMDAYHMLCNIIALSGCILTIKHSSRKLNDELKDSVQTSKDDSRSVEVVHVDEKQRCGDSDQHQHELKLRNTFGWTRIDILTMLIVCIFLASLSFSLLVEALQTLVHINHQDTMHLPIPIIILGIAGIILNGICYILIGGYTLHQGSFLHVTLAGDVVLNRAKSSDELKPDERQLSKAKRDHIAVNLNDINCRGGKRQGFVEIFRDMSSTLFVIICAIIVYFADNENITKFVDPVISICSCLLLVILSYPYMKESCLILLQTIPGSIDIEIFKSTLLSTFKDIVSVHDLHIWQLTASKYVSTVHIIFQNPIVYSRIMDDIKKFFHEQGITIVTIQPEFKTTKLLTTIPEECLVRCHDLACVEKHCCRQIKSNLSEIVLHENKKQNDKKTKNNLANILTFGYAQKSKSTNNLCVSKSNGQLKKFSSDSRIDKEDVMENSKDQVVSDNRDLSNSTDIKIANNKIILSSETK